MIEKTKGQPKHTNLQRISDDMWKFSLLMGGFIINGFTYSERNRQIRFPSCKWGEGPPRKIGRAHGIHIVRLRGRIEQDIQERNGDTN